ncbi:MAG: hypothetical protein WBA43_17210 [Elainellaceae cyanobacterium]
MIDQATRDLINRLLLERISLAGIARSTQVFEQWLQTYVNGNYAQVPRQVRHYFCSTTKGLDPLFSFDSFDI